MRKSDRICMSETASAAECAKVGCGYQAENASIGSSAVKPMIRCHVLKIAPEDPVPLECLRFLAAQLGRTAQTGGRLAAALRRVVHNYH